MRTLVGCSLALAFFPSVAESQARDSSTWSFGASRGFVVTGSSSFTRAEGGANTLMTEWRRPGSRLGVRFEAGFARRRLSYLESSICTGCFLNERQQHGSALVSVVQEWRQSRLMRPYVLAGAGAAFQSWRTHTNTRPQDFLWALDSVETRTHRSALSMQAAAGFGLSVNVGRAAVFGESRARFGRVSPLETFAVGLRIKGF